MWFKKLFFPSHYATEFRICKRRAESFGGVNIVYYAQYRIGSGRWRSPYLGDYLYSDIKKAEEVLKDMKDIATYYQNKEWGKIEVVG